MSVEVASSVRNLRRVVVVEIRSWLLHSLNLLLGACEPGSQVELVRLREKLYLRLGPRSPAPEFPSTFRAMLKWTAATLVVEEVEAAAWILQYPWAKLGTEHDSSQHVSFSSH
jgi:hypothetical protein